MSTFPGAGTRHWPWGCTGPLQRTAAYLSATAGLRLRGERMADGVPLPPVSAAVAAHVALDEVALAAFGRLRPVPSAAVWRRIEAETDRAVAMFDAEGWLADPTSYLQVPPPLVAPIEHRVRVRTGPIEVLTFPSGWAPRPTEPGAARWMSYSPNDVARAHVLRHPDRRPRPWVVYVHATGMGRPDSDIRVSGVRHLHRDLGCNVVMPVLPLHGARRPARVRGAHLPTLDVLDNVHGLAQAAWDVRRVLSWVRSQDGTGVGLVGMSLGGYVAALVAGLEQPLSCVVAVVPAVDFPTVFRRHLGGVAGRRLPRGAGPVSDLLHLAVSPLLLPPATPVDRRFLLGCTADRMLAPAEQVAALWSHWGRPRIHWTHSGHVGQLVRGEVREFVDGALRCSGLVGHPPV